MVSDPVTVLRGIRFLGRFSKECHYARKYIAEEQSRGKFGWTSSMFYGTPPYYEPAEISEYWEAIEQQKKLGFKNWELI